MADLIQIKGGRKPNPEIIAVLREALEAAERAELDQVLIAECGPKGRTVTAAVNDPVELAGVLTAIALPWLTEPTDENE